MAAKTLKCLSLLIFLLLQGCGYSFQSSRSSAFEKEGIEKVYVAPFTNGTYKPGVENLVYNSLVRGLSGYGRVKIVQHRELADAVLEGSVSTASFASIGNSQVSSMLPSIGGGLPTSVFPVASTYQAILSCTFSLNRIRIKKKGQKAVVWTGSFNRWLPFAGANQLDVPGTTSPLINDSEFDRALTDMAKSMMDDVNNSMVAMF
jgi:hypothetical protein